MLRRTRQSTQSTSELSQTGASDLKIWKARTLPVSMIGVAIGILATLGATRIVPMVRDCFGPSHVTLMNASGEEICDITISLGRVKRDVSILKHQQAITVAMHGRFSECSTQVEWTDSAGRHSASAADYMESHGSYHARVVITPDREAIAVFDITRSSKALLSDAANSARER